jgi:hypothetical protein
MGQCARLVRSGKQLFGCAIAIRSNILVVRAIVADFQEILHLHKECNVVFDRKEENFRNHA